MRRRRPRPSLLAALAGVLVPLASLLPAPAAADTTLEIDAGFGGAFIAGAAVPVRVQVRADRLVRGSLEVAVDSPGGETSVSLPVEVPGGSVKRYVVVAPTSAIGDVADLSVLLRHGGDTVAAGRARLEWAVDEELVGLLPLARAGRPVPGPAPLAVDAGIARFFPLTDAELGAAPASLEALGTIGAGSDELARLPPASRAAILRWVGAGGRLLTDATPGETVAGLPQEWQPGADGRAVAGRGEVVAVDGALGRGAWEGLVEPSATAGGSGRQFSGGPGVGEGLARDAGVRIPRLGWLLGFLVVYVFVVGPVTATVLRRRGRPELAWVVVPLVAVLFASGSWAGGRRLHRGVRLVHGSVLQTGPEGATATTYVGVAHESGGTARVGFPDDWVVGAPGWPEGGQSAGRVAVGLGPGGPEGRLRLATGQFGLLLGRGPVDVPGALEVTAASPADGVAEGTVRNRTGERLQEVAVFVAGAATRIGTLQPGEEARWQVRVEPGGFEDGPAEAVVWQRGGFGSPPDPDDAVDWGLWASSGLGFGSPSRRTGSALAVGWTRDLASPVTMAGGRRAGGRTMVVGETAVRPGRERIADLAVRRDLLRGWRSVESPDLRGGIRGERGVLRFLLPDRDVGGPALGDRGLILQAPSNAGLELWVDGRWSALPPPLGAPNPRLPMGPQGPLVDYDVPAGAVRAGTVYARLLGSEGPFIAQFATLRQAP